MINLKISLLLLSVLDITLTHFMLWRDKKVGLLDIGVERAAVARKIFDMFGVNTTSFLISACLSIAFFTFLFNVVSPWELRDGLLIVIGVFSTVNLYHLIQIQDQELFKNSELFKAYKNYRKTLKKVSKAQKD